MLGPEPDGPSRSSRKNAAPADGPTSVPRPPMTLKITTSPDTRKKTKSGAANQFWIASSTPARPANSRESSAATILSGWALIADGAGPRLVSWM